MYSGGSLHSEVEGARMSRVADILDKPSLSYTHLLKPLPWILGRTQLSRKALLLRLRGMCRW